MECKESRFVMITMHTIEAIMHAQDQLCQTISGKLLQIAYNKFCVYFQNNKLLIKQTTMLQMRLNAGRIRN